MKDQTTQSRSQSKLIVPRSPTTGRNSAGVLTAFLLIATALSLRAAEAPKPYHGSPEFEKMKALVGTWKGKTDMGQGPMELTVEYRLVSGGSVVEERIFAGTPQEMVTMYHDRQGKLTLTHYCMLGNSPGMIIKSSSPKSLEFDFDPTCGVDAKSEKHMHALTLTFESNDTLLADWKLFDAGKGQESHPFTLKRAKS